MTVMVTGGAGYIGSHVVRLLHERGDSVVIVDDMSNGIASRIEGLPLEQIDVSSHTATEQLGEVIKRYNVDSVVHFAAKKNGRRVGRKSTQVLSRQRDWAGESA